MERIRTASAHYVDFWRTCLPAMWFYLPPFFWVPSLPCFKEIIDREDDLPTDAWTVALEQLPLNVAEWMKRKRNEHLAMLPVSVTNSTSMEPILLSNPVAAVKRQERMRGYAGQLELVTSVFVDGIDKRAIIGRETCHAWKLDRELSFSAAGAMSAAAVVSALRLDPNMAIDTQLDTLDSRLICLNCLRDNDVDDLSVYSWRLCVGIASPCLLLSLLMLALTDRT